MTNCSFASLGSLLDIIKHRMRLVDCKTGVLDEATIATVLKEVLKGLDYFHNNGQIHRSVSSASLRWLFKSNNVWKNYKEWAIHVNFKATEQLDEYAVGSSNNQLAWIKRGELCFSVFSSFRRWQWWWKQNCLFLAHLAARQNALYWLMVVGLNILFWLHLQTMGYYCTLSKSVASLRHLL